MTVDDLRCPSCAAALRPGAAWCSLCHADLRTEAERAAARPQPAEPEPADPDPADAADSADAAGLDPGTTLASTAGTTLTAAPPLGKHARPAAAAVAPVVPASDAPADPRLAGINVDAMLAELAKDKDPVLSGFNSRFATKTQRTLAVTIGSLVMMGLAFATMFVLGSFVH